MSAPSKREKILDAALTLFIQNGFDKTATAQIAKTAGVANGTLFHHFSNKQTLITAVYSRCKLAMLEALSPVFDDSLAPEVILQNLIGTFYQWLLDNPDSFRFFQIYGDSSHIDEDTKSQIQTAFKPFTELLSTCAEAGVLAPVPISLLQQMMANQVFTAVAFLHENPGLKEDKFLVEHLQKSCFRLITKS